MRHHFCTALAPSTSAASYSSRQDGADAGQSRAHDRSRNDEDRAEDEGSYSAMFGSCSQSLRAAGQAAQRRLKKPYSGWKDVDQTSEMTMMLVT